MTNLLSHPSCLLQIDPETGKHFTNLFEFIPMDHWILDTLHLLLRCVDTPWSSSSCAWWHLWSPTRPSR